MKSDKIADDHTVVRKIPKSRLTVDFLTGEPVPLPQAFELRPDEEYLSASWLEFHGEARNVCIEKTVHTLRRCVSIKPKDKCGFAMGNVGAIKETCKAFKKAVRIVHERTKNNPAYAAVRQIAPNNLELMEALAKGAWRSVVLNADIPEQTLPKPDQAKLLH
ncbi:hypothetical protein EOB59_03420 [Mesorhizobium sp. M7A.F.Ca.MR.176.00.0.0]|uniref:hypothetical protein n=1 Tax=Mesorhizobium sp. M7A.F.Ca.MR.176.00.0.0 TaxID=2496776 RepID=UPI000FD46CB9|nr:hypothetical protein [Mesorhizobium sp. M7A.F.Ca.MR.176.00.0.0]RUU93364.1 hypothetical protein EOB59_03420 [Mesorhizobium sp. M7A.F.Ca.MR.176.00.0.0]